MGLINAPLWSCVVIFVCVGISAGCHQHFGHEGVPRNYRNGPSKFGVRKFYGSKFYQKLSDNGYKNAPQYGPYEPEYEHQPLPPPPPQPPQQMLPPPPQFIPGPPPQMPRPYPRPIVTYERLPPVSHPVAPPPPPPPPPPMRGHPQDQMYTETVVSSGNCPTCGSCSQCDEENTDYQYSDEECPCCQRGGDCPCCQRGGECPSSGGDDTPCSCGGGCSCGGNGGECNCGGRCACACNGNDDCPCAHGGDNHGRAEEFQCPCACGGGSPPGEGNCPCSGNKDYSYEAEDYPSDCPCCKSGCPCENVETQECPCACSGQSEGPSASLRELPQYDDYSPAHERDMDYRSEPQGRGMVQPAYQPIPHPRETYQAPPPPLPPQRFGPVQKFSPVEEHPQYIDDAEPPPLPPRMIPRRQPPIQEIQERVMPFRREPIQISQCQCQCQLRGNDMLPPPPPPMQEQPPMMQQLPAGLPPPPPPSMQGPGAYEPMPVIMRPPPVMPPPPPPPPPMIQPEPRISGWKKFRRMPPPPPVPIDVEQIPPVLPSYSRRRFSRLYEPRYRKNIPPIAGGKPSFLEGLNYGDGC